MKTPRSTLALIGLFFAALAAMWWLDRVGVPTERERRARLDRVLPELIDAPEASMTRVEIDRGGDTLVFERRGGHRWQMTRPLEAAADPSALESLVRNLKDLRRSPDSGTITGAAETFGLAPPEATIRLWAADTSARSSERSPIATLELGKTIRGSRYVRSSGGDGIEVIDPKLLDGLDRPISRWREHSLMPVPTFQVSRMEIRRDGLDLKAERAAGGRWRLTAPVAVPANGAKIESTLAAISSIRVADDGKGFAADDVADLKPFGLDKPVATIELIATTEPAAPLVLHVGKPARDGPERVYVRRGDQDDVASVDAKFLAEVPHDTVAFRSQHVAEINAAAVSEILIEALNTTFSLARKGTGWELSSPKAGRADAYLVQAFLNQVENLQTSEFLAPARVIQPMLEPPAMTIKLWQTNSSRSSAPTRQDKPSRPPAFSLKLGRHDILKKAVYAQLWGDDMILALPDVFLKVLPGNHLAFRDRGILSLNPGAVTRLTFEREGKATVLELDRSSSSPNRWRMTAPVAAPADVQAITQVMALLTGLRAEEFASDSGGDSAEFGLDRPSITASWQTEESPAGPGDQASSGSLRIGKAVPGKPGMFYASLRGSPFVFTLAEPAVQAFQAEFHDTRLMTFPPESIRSLTLHAAGRTLSFARSLQPRGGPGDWSAPVEADIRGIDLSRFDDIVRGMAQLRTTRFYQYGGPIPPGTGLTEPRLILELGTGEGKPPYVLRIGESLINGQAFAATGSGDTGPVFFLPAPAWDALIISLPPPRELPDDVFAPADVPASGAH